MGVYIKSMEMPKNCMECPFSDHEAWCLIPGDSKKRYYCPTEVKSEHCPLVEVPEPHGDLIDRQKLLEDNKHLEYPTNGKYRRDRAWAVGFNSGARHCNEHAVYAKTVIEAEGE